MYIHTCMYHRLQQCSMRVLTHIHIHVCIIQNTYVKIYAKYRHKLVIPLKYSWDSWTVLWTPTRKIQHSHQNLQYHCDFESRFRPSVWVQKCKAHQIPLVKVEVYGWLQHFVHICIYIRSNIITTLKHGQVRTYRVNAIGRFICLMLLWQVYLNLFY